MFSEHMFCIFLQKIIFIKPANDYNNIDWVRVSCVNLSKTFLDFINGWINFLRQWKWINIIYSWLEFCYWMLTANTIESWHTFSCPSLIDRFWKYRVTMKGNLRRKNAFENGIAHKKKMFAAHIDVFYARERENVRKTWAKNETNLHLNTCAITQVEGWN